jgi:WD40 repeat protein
MRKLSASLLKWSTGTRYRGKDYLAVLWPAGAFWLRAVLLTTWCLFADDALADDVVDNSLPAIEEPAEDFVPQFARDIAPLLQRNCLACHNQTDAEADVVLESPAAMLDYESDEPLIVPGDASAGKLFAVAAHLSEPVMPPEDNDVGATRLSPRELGLLKRWIELGAKPGDAPGAPTSLQWQPVPAAASPVLAARFSPPGDFCVAAAGNYLVVRDLVDGSTARLVDPALAERDANFSGAAHLDVVHAVAVRGDGQQIATGGYRTVKLWRRQRGSRAIALPVGSATTVVSISVETGWMVAGAVDGKLALVRLRGAQAGDAAAWQGHEAHVVAVRLTADGQQLVSVDAHGAVKNWRVADHSLAGEWILADKVRLATWIDDETLVTAADDLALRVWKLPASAPGEAGSAAVHVESAAQLRGHGREITAMAAAAGGSVLSGSHDGFLRLWDAAGGTQRRQWIHGRTIVAVGVHPDGNRFVSVGDDGIVKAWSPDADDPLWESEIDFPHAARRVAADQAVQLATENLALADEALSVARKQLATDQKNLATTQAALAEAQQALAEAAKAAESPEEQKNESAVADATAAKEHAEALLRRADEGQRSSEAVVRQAEEVQHADRETLHESQQTQAAVSSATESRARIVSVDYDSRTQSLIFADAAGRVFVWSWTGRPMATWQAADRLSAARVAGEELVVVSASDAGTAAVAWSTAGPWTLEDTLGSPDDPGSFLLGRVSALDFSPDGRLLAMGSGAAARSGQVVLWDLVQRRIYRKDLRAHQDEVLAVEFSRDGRFLATAGADQMAKILGVEDGQEVGVLEGHTHHVLDVAWRANGLQIATASADKSIKIWDVRSAQQLRTIAGGREEITGVAFLGLGNQLASSAGDGVLRIYNADDAAQMRAISTGAAYLFGCSASGSGDLVLAGGPRRFLGVYRSSDGAPVPLGSMASEGGAPLGGRAEGVVR